MAELHQLVARIEQLLLRHQELEKKYTTVCHELQVSQSQCVVLRSQMRQAQVRIRSLIENLPESTLSHSASNHETY